MMRFKQFNWRLKKLEGFSNLLWFLGGIGLISMSSIPILNAQNLVPNPHFTVYTGCPFTKGQINRAEPWYSPNGKTTDFIHSCGERGGTGIPENFWGYQYPAIGSGYAGLRTWLDSTLLYSGEIYREYLAVKMKDTLKKGETYFISFKVSVGDSAQYITDDIGLAFSDTVFPNSDLLDIPPAIANRQGRFINNFNDWVLIYGFYEAKGGELHLVIGNFLDNEETSIQSRYGEGGPEQSTYFYIDDVVVEPCNVRFPKEIILAEDSTLCPGDSITLHAVMEEDSDIFWENGSKDTNRVITAPGTYVLDMEIRGCIRKDTIEIMAAETPDIDLGNDTTLCEGETILLNLPDTRYSYNWSDRSVASSLLVDSPGLYKVEASNDECVITDSISIQYEFPTQNPPINDTLICDNTEIMLASSREGIAYSWNNQSTSVQIKISEAGEYWVDVQSRCFEQREYFKVAVEDCSCDGIFPNVFTPNNDGFNDVIAPQLKAGVSTYRYEIYDQWGRLHFRTEDPSESWDGTSSLGTAREGVYFWKAEYTCQQEGENLTQVKQGYLNLFR